MAFRSPDNVQRNELVRFQLESNIRAPSDGAEQQKNGYKFVVNDRGTFYDWFNAFFEVRFKLDLKQMVETMPTNGLPSLMVLIH